jgi:hypothetical protein
MTDLPASEGHTIFQQKRKRIEQGFGWAKTVAHICQVLVRGLEKVDQMFVLTMTAYKHDLEYRELTPLKLQGLTVNC